MGNPRNRRRGVAMVWVAMLFTFLMMMMAFTVDLSRLYVARAQAQKAADSAALAGAYQYANANGSQADPQSRAYAKMTENGAYEQGVRDTTVTTTYQPVDEFGVKQVNWYRVQVSRIEPTFFAGIFGSKWRSIPVGAQSTALYESLVPIDINGSTAGTYGIAPGPANLALFGPNGAYNNGDKYSVRKLANGEANPDYFGPDSDKSKKGYDFLISIPKTFRDANSMAYFQIFDPDCYNINGGTEANGTASVDEMRNSAAGASTADADKTTTQYSLYNDNATPGNPNDDVLYAQKSYGGTSAEDRAADMKWNDFFSGNPNGLKTGEGLRLNVMSTSGASENGFSLRVNNAPATSTATFNSNNGTAIKADGILPINFNQGGTVTMSLGVVPSAAANTKLSISKFDTDVQNGNRPNTIKYFCDPAPSNQPSAGYNGVLSNNGDEKVDIINLPSDYKGGQWRAVYSAGAQDTSIWSLSFTGATPGTPGNIRLVR